MSIPKHIRDLERFYHILESIEMIEQHVGNPPCLNDQKTVDAVYYRLQIIGEAANHIPQNYQTEFSEVPWRKMIAMRNYLAHEYFAVHMDKILAAIQDIPRIKQIIRHIIIELEHDFPQ